MRRVLGEKFFGRSAPTVAAALLGKVLCRRIGTRTVCVNILETEAYQGLEDKASHAHHGQTSRNYVMFGRPGRFYVYFTYGMHWMLNVVTGKEGDPGAVLIRGVEGLSGPGRLTKKLLINKKLNGKRATRSSGLWFEDRGVRVEKTDIKKTSRIGVGYAGEWSKKPYRFVLIQK